MNSSVRGPDYQYWLLRYSILFHRKPNIGLCGISMNSLTTHISEKEFRPHVQSFYIFTNINVLKAVFPNHLPGALSQLNDKKRIIFEGEIGLSQGILDYGYGICCSSCPSFVYFKGKQWEIPFGDWRYKYNRAYRWFVNKI